MIFFFFYFSLFKEQWGDFPYILNMSLEYVGINTREKVENRSKQEGYGCGERWQAESWCEAAEDRQSERESEGERGQLLLWPKKKEEAKVGEGYESLN